MTNGFHSLAFGDGSFSHGDVQFVRLPSSAVRDPATWAREMFALDSAPFPVRALMGARDRLVALFGLRPASAGAFEVQQAEGEEALIAFDDSHLDFRCAVGIDPETSILRVVTTVWLHNWAGRLYFAPVKLAHPTIVRAMIRRTSRQFTRAWQESSGE